MRNQAVALRGLLGTFTTATNRARLQSAINNLTAAGNSGAWLNESHLVRGPSDAVFAAELAGARTLVNLLKLSLTTAQRTGLTTALRQLAVGERVLFQVALAEAPGRGISAANLALARAEFARAETNFNAGRFPEAMNNYANAWGYATKP